jgi:hypothetical protein
MESIILTRSQLYDLVWKEPMLTLSKKYDISDVGLRKMCIRLNIPVPQAGHWQKVKFGKKPHQLKLPKNFDGEDQVTLKLRGEKEEGENTLPSISILRQEIKNDSRLILTIPEKLSRPDKLIVEAKEKLSSTDRYSRYKDVVTSDRDTIDIRVSKKFISRSLRFMDTLIKDLRTRGHNIEIKMDGWRAGTYVIVQGQKIRILLRERLKKVIVKGSYYNSTELHPGGTLFFRMEGDGSREWKDGKSLIDEHLEDIIAMLELEGQKLVIREEVWRKEREINEAKEKIRKEIEKRRQEEFDDLRDLLGKFAKWQKARQLREYLDELERMATKNNNRTEKFNSWLSRAREKVAWYAPLIEKQDEWLDGFDRGELDGVQSIDSQRSRRYF